MRLISTNLYICTITLGLKQQIGKYYYKGELNKNKRTKAFVPFSQAKTVGILYNASNEQMKKTAHQLISALQAHKKDVQSLGFINAKKIPEGLHITYGYEYFNRSHLNWLGLPVHSHLESFLQKEFDYLINLDTEKIQYSFMAARSAAKCKIAPSNTLYKEAYDLMLDAKNADFISELLRYLQKIG